MRTLPRAGAVCAVAAAALFAAPSAHATVPGDNGTVKIHDASTGEELKKNEPHVCSFYLDGFGFDSAQQIDWHIDAVPPSDNSGETVKSGTLVLDDQGHGRTENLSLPDGHYKLYWNFDDENGRAKQKVFWSECEDSGQGGGGSASPSASPSASASASASPSAPASGSPSASSPAGAAPSASASGQGGASGDLAETGNGAPVGLLSGVAALLVAAGGFLAFRRRKAQQG
ncbi:LPXTG cell wall anchor domain-containing protein [Streptomyces griseosporeus]|uniref:LPXTG cell wall anchor domain-containing protein n=1 Tax=Streptomyces griseosporeus TaxID=1910 RepID=UPI0036FE65FF